MRNSIKSILILLTAAALFVSCQKDQIILPPADPQEEKEDDGIYKGLIPQKTDGLARIFINTPDKIGVDKYDKTVWTENCSIQIKATVDGEEKTVYNGSLKIRGRGNSTWESYPKKPYRFNLSEMWPCYPNPLSYAEGLDGEINFDERMSFDEAISEMKTALRTRISYMDQIIANL